MTFLRVARVAAGEGPAFAAWDKARLEREVTYGAENREAAAAGDRDSADLESGGYEMVALALMRAIAHDERTTLILNVRNRGTLDVLDADAVVEVPCCADSNGPRPLAADPNDRTFEADHRRRGRSRGRLFLCPATAQAH